MQVQIVHHDSEGNKTDLGMRELSHMPPIAEPFPLDGMVYVTRAYFGPDAQGIYLLVLEGAPQTTAEGRTS
ncbi:MAG: hypothetical protein ACTHL1_11540 [Burkholderiaceae bacterium]